MVRVDNKKRRTNDEPNQLAESSGNTKSCMGSDEKNIDDMEHESKDPKNMFMVGSCTGLRQGL